MNLGLNKCSGQCYDGASNISGPKSGVAKQLSYEEPRALYLHCHSHALNLAAGDAIKKVQASKDTLDVAFEDSKLLKFSPKRTAKLEKLREELALASPGFRMLCLTRWTVRAASLKVNLAELVLKHIDNLSRTLQSTSMSASEGANIAAMTVTTLGSLRTDDHFTAFWDHLINAQQDLDVCEPKLPRRRKVPKLYDDGAPVNFPDDCQTHYRQSYFSPSTWWSKLKRTDHTDNLSCVEVANSFVCDSEYRLSVFGHFQR
ncbi:Zinc finger MYM-type protein 1-like [Oopsacas minuta]|uniref:Zinc finger MYM-type protein 1-like n=1 Tax=Oopsacas minuta TaxID=111878 RepID=A0AAV7KA08_9METZ|nr:Zinc finger MYM-type protein 1-like [Oopsacas minuta]